jgi:phosphoglucomutase
LIDIETNLEIGDPYKLPFENYKDGFIGDELQENILKRLKFGVASPSGIRQIFDSTNGDEETDYVDGTNTEITPAAKVHIATITECFLELLRKETGKESPTVVIAIDSRHTGPAISDVVIRILAFHKVKTIYTFITPVTEVAVYSREVADGFIYISASHNPKGYNGLKMGLNDARVLPRHLALPFIQEYKSRINDKQNTRTVIQRANSADPEEIKQVYDDISKFREKSRGIYSKFCDSLITGLKEPHQIAQQKSSLREEIQKRDIWLGIDPNGGARQDREYLESWGFNVLEINSRPRMDMRHELAPTPAACEQAKKTLIEARRAGKKVIAFLVYDTDGDRKNMVIPDREGGALVPGVQIVFALDVLCAILDAKLSAQYDKIGLVVNDPTSSILEQLAQSMDFTVKRVEVGEANVATGGKILHHQGVHVPIMGEGSNGSVFNLELLVREPMHTIRTLVNFITRPELTKKLLSYLHQEAKYNDWHSSDRIQNLLAQIISVLPPSATTDFFTDEGIRRGGTDLPILAFKANFDDYFQSQVWHKIEQELKREYGVKPTMEFINYEGENELRGKGKRETGLGGYKIEFNAEVNNSKKHIGWIWFRQSGTERGVMRRGVSISHWEINSEAVKSVNKVYKYIDSVLTETINAVEEKTLS